MAMSEDYTDIIQQVSQLVFEAIQEREENLSSEVKELDGELAKLLRLVGKQVMSMCLNEMAQKVTTESKKTGLVVHRRDSVKYSVIFGVIEVKSPYLWHKQEGWGVRPVVEKLGIKHKERSIAVKRALTDFGSEESFGQAAKRFKEHYGWTVERGAIRREVEAIANEAESFVEKRLKALETKFKNLIPPKRRSGWNRVLVELDGCQIRTGILMSGETEELTSLRRLKKRKRPTDWREVRVGLARPVENKESRTFIGRMGKYPELVPQLHSAAVDQGLSIYTLVFGVADGGNGLKEALEAKFTNFQFILDYAHFKQHLYQAVEAMELEPKWRSIWLSCVQDLIEGGRVKTIISRLKHWSGQGKEIVFNFAKYLERFRQSVHYQKYREWGLPIGSGEIESSHRYIPQKRLKIPGATWHPNMINPMLALRVIRANDWWSDFWQTYTCSEKLLMA